MRTRRWAILAAIVVIAVVGTAVGSGPFGRIIIRAPIILLRAMLRLNQPAPVVVEKVDVTGGPTRNGPLPLRTAPRSVSPSHD